MAGAVIRNSRNEWFAVSSQRASKHGAFLDGELLQMHEIGMHLERAASIANTVGELRDELSTLRRVLNNSPYGIVLFDHEASVRWLNRTAENVLRSSDSLTITKHQTTCQKTCCVRENRCAHSWTRSIPAWTKEFRRAGASRIERLSGKRPYQLTISPIAKDSTWGNKNLRGDDLGRPR